MAGVNKVILVGHLGKDPEVRHLENGTSVASFTLATSENYTRDGKKVEQTEWHNIVVWRGLADVAEKYLKKGELIYVEGKLRTRSYDDKNGVKRYQTEVVADNFTMLGKKSSSGDEQSNSTDEKNTSNHQEPAVDFAPDTSDDLPF
ncbi:Single-stranded DNA-binding protein [Arcticibacter svalbardensis MN12-7]|uniref:Single-stranded DNA-binding protein n=1 Tax=Arcticibacter svalbardensis MN12-7 TaxID=1150600 RepID=R9GSR9_9SPHI|nr:single-stranded DNA-binding protein [Arcticibacter svalbardensis]EOR94718.1 Single-stranded DNA-binding protein [Arcticibacter svalbardensis MN12-7]